MNQQILPAGAAVPAPAKAAAGAAPPALVTISGPIAVAPTASVRDVIAAALRVTAGHLRGNAQAAALGTAPEGVHQMRIATRRLRSAITAFRHRMPVPLAERLGAELRWLMGALGPARDWDVFIAGTLGPLQRMMPRDEGLERLAVAADSARADAYADVRAALSGARFDALLAELERLAAMPELRPVAAALQQPETAAAGALVPAQQLVPAPPPGMDDPVRGVADDVLARRWRRLRKAARALPGGAIDDLHRVRIAAKKMRYMAEFFAPLYAGRRAERYLKRLRAVQDSFGALNDSAVAETLLHALQARAAGSGDRDVAFVRAEGLVGGWHAARIERERARTRKAWRRLRRAERFWR